MDSCVWRYDSGIALRCMASHLSKLDPLSEGQLFRPVDGIRLPPHVSFPGIRSRFSTPPSFLFTAKGSPDLGSRGADIHVGDATI